LQQADRHVRPRSPIRTERHSAPRAATRARTLAGLLVFLSIAGLAGTAAAQTGLGGASGTTAFTADDFRIVVQQAQGSAFSDFDLQRFFNISNCQCNVPVYLFFTFNTSGFQKKAGLPAGSIEFWTGLSCNDTITGARNSRCTPLYLAGTQGAYSMVLSSFAAAGGVIIPTDTQTLSQNFGQPSTSTTGGGGASGTGSTTTGPSGDAACGTGIAFSQNIWALVTFSGDTTYDIATTLAVSIDLAPPPPPDPDSIEVTGGNEALVTTWTPVDAAITPDILGYQLLCDRGGALQVFPTGSFATEYGTCNKTTLPDDGLDAHIRGLDGNFVCSPLLSALVSSHRIKILENGVTYGVGVVAIDSHHNASAPVVIYGAPKKTLSFYDVYRNGDSTNNQPGAQPDPGGATGGYCAVPGGPMRRTGAAGAGVVGLALAIAAARRRARRRK
jgi:hypothetical protein